MRLKSVLTGAETNVWSSYSEMMAALKSCTEWKRVLGKAAEAQAGFQGLIIGEKGNPIAGIGVVLSGTGIEPSALILPGTSLMWLGFNDDVALVDLRNGDIIAEHKLDWAFYDMYHLPNTADIVVLNELGASLLAPNGIRRWSFSLKSILVNHSLEDDCLLLGTENGKKLRINIRTGDVLT